MHRIIVSALSTILLTSCASFRPVQYVGGKRNANRAQLQACSNYILTFPTAPEKVSVAGAIDTLKIKESEIYSIEESTWPYLFFIYGYRCVHFNMNDSYIAPIPPPSSKPAPKASFVLPPAAEPLPPPPPQPPPPPEPEPGVITGDREKDFIRCDKLLSLARTDCRKTIFKHYENLNKGKKK